MAGMGPPPKNPNQRRRPTQGKQLAQLPQKRTGPTPKWPLSFAPSPAQQGLWRELWRLPAAVVWERIGCAREVAQYVIWKVKAEEGSLRASAEARQLSDRLGLSPLALLRMGCEVAADEVEQRRAARPAASPRRLKAVDPGVVARSV